MSHIYPKIEAKLNNKIHKICSKREYLKSQFTIHEPTPSNEQIIIKDPLYPFGMYFSHMINARIYSIPFEEPEGIYILLWFYYLHALSFSRIQGLSWKTSCIYIYIDICLYIFFWKDMSIMYRHDQLHIICYPHHVWLII